MRPRRILGVAVLLICFVLIGGYIWVDSIAVQSSSLEQTSGFTSNCGPACEYNLGPISDWTGTRFGGPFEASGFFGPVPAGSYVGFIIVPLSQDLDVAQTPEQNHTFAVFVGDQPDVDLFIWPISLNTGDTVGIFEQEAGTFSTDSSEPTFPSGNLTFPLTGGGSPTNTDRPTVSTPEPASVALLATGLFFVALFGGLYKGKQAIQKVA